MPKIVDHEARRWEICAITAGLLAKGGMDAATIREIAKASGYSKGVIEHYFENKSELISGALDWANRGYEERASQLTEGLQGLAAIRKQIEAILPLNPLTHDEWKVRLISWSIAAIDPELRKRQANRFERAVAYFAQAITEAIKSGEMPADSDPDTVARRIVNLTTGICTSALYNPTLYSPDLLLDEVENLLHLMRSGSLNNRQVDV